MNKFGKYVLRSLGLNFASFVILFIIVFSMSSSRGGGLEALIIGFFVGVFSLVIQLIVSLIFIIGEKKELGKAMLLSIGIILLVGLSICSGV
jgi:hypothetical protein